MSLGWFFEAEFLAVGATIAQSLLKQYYRTVVLFDSRKREYLTEMHLSNVPQVVLHQHLILFCRIKASSFFNTYQQLSYISRVVLNTNQGLSILGELLDFVKRWTCCCTFVQGILSVWYSPSSNIMNYCYQLIHQLYKFANRFYPFPISSFL